MVKTLSRTKNVYCKLQEKKITYKGKTIRKQLISQWKF